MKRLFLFKLYHYSKFGFAIVSIYICLMIFLIFKKTDWLLFPRNDMFSGQRVDSIQKIPRLYVDGNPVKTSGMLYWKKDFLEQSLQLYQRYKITHQVYQVNWLNRKQIQYPWLAECRENITPKESSIHWYAHLAGIESDEAHQIEIRVDTIHSNQSDGDLRISR
jgi:hypothetical protein